MLQNLQLFAKFQKFKNAAPRRYARELQRAPPGLPEGARGPGLPRPAGLHRRGDPVPRRARQAGPHLDLPPLAASAERNRRCSNSRLERTFLISNSFHIFYTNLNL